MPLDKYRFGLIGHRFFVWVGSPKSTNSDKPKLKGKTGELLPRFIQHFESDNLGMHTTNSVDCTYVISGSIILELNEGDSIIQNGTRHW